MRRLDRYELGDEIGSGASARVLRGFDTELKRPVAVKIMHGHLVGKGSYTERFRREALAVAALQHPNILRVYDVAPANANEFYFVTELIEGGTVADWLRAERDSKVPHEIALCVALQVLRGLEAAHKMNLVHRDLKPENLMLGEDGYIKIADFGIARRDTDADLTLSGSLMGSPAFMSPEQIDGKQVDARADLFAFGVVYYLLVTGRLPFGEGPVVPMLQRISRGEHTPVRDVEPSLDPRIAEIIEACLEVDPDRRPASAQAVRERLQPEAHARGLGDPSEEILGWRHGNEEARKRRIYNFVESLVAEAKRLLESGRDPTLAMALIDRALELHPFHFEAYRLLEKTGARQRSRALTISIALVAIAGLAFGGWWIVRNHLASRSPGSAPLEQVLAQTLGGAGDGPLALPTLQQSSPKGGPSEVRQPRTENREPTTDGPLTLPTLQQSSPKGGPSEVRQPRTENRQPTSDGRAGTLALLTRPWAEVYVDEETAPRGRTPFLKELPLEPGSHVIRFKNPQTRLVEVYVEIESGRRLEKIVDLPLLPGLIVLRTADDEDVFLDDAPLDPALRRNPFEVTHGEHNLRFVRGGESRQITVTVPAGREVEAVSPFAGEALESPAAADGEP